MLHRTLALVARAVKTGDVAGAVGQRLEVLLAAGKAQVDKDRAAAPFDLLAQYRQGEIVAGAQAQGFLLGEQILPQLGEKLRLQAGRHRGEARQDPLLRPHQPGAEGGQRGAAAALLDDEFGAEPLFLRPHHAPGMAVGHAERACRLRQRPRNTHAFEQHEQRVVGRDAAQSVVGRQTEAHA